ncbi:MAG: ankyrin repeat domain-containing protein [Bermanella sp.]
MFKIILYLIAVVAMSGCASTHIWELTQDGDTEGLAAAIAEGKDVNAVNDSNNSAIHLALLSHPEYIPSLISAGADLNQRTKEGRTPLIVAVSYFSKSKPSHTQLLINAGANVNAKQTTGWLFTALHLSATAKTEHAKLLLKAGADANSKAIFNSTPLHFSVLYNPELIPLLLEYGSDPTLKTTSDAYFSRDYGQLCPPKSFDQTPLALLSMTPLEIAKKCNIKKAIELLTEKQPFELAYQKCELKTPTTICYQNFIKKFPKVKLANSAQIKIGNLGISNKKKLKEDKIAQLAKIKNAKAKKKFLNKKQTCKLNSPKWIYLSAACSGGLAHGMGKAATFGGLTFIGKFEQGYRVHGKILANDVLMFDGQITDGRPSGEGVCMYQGEPEECKFYDGKRIDTLYKQRIEFAKQNEKMDAQQQAMADQQLEIRASQMKQDEILAEHSRLISESRSTKKYSDNNGGGSNILVESLKKKASDKLTDALFDQLW